MSKKLKITFERGGVVYANLLSEEAPKTVEAILNTLPRREKVYHAKYAGCAIFIDTGITEMEKEHTIQEKKPGRISLTLGKPTFTGKCIHLWYNDYILSVKDENHFAEVEKEYLPVLESVGFRVFHEGPELATFEVVDA